MSLSIVFARAFVAEFERRGLDAEQLLARSDIAPERLTDIRQQLAYDETARLTRNAVTLSDDPAIGLSLGVHVPINMMQLVAHLMLAQRTPRQAFEAFQRYSALISEGPSFELREEGELATWACVPAVPASDVTRVLMDYVIVMAARVGRQLRAPNAPPVSRLREVRFQHAAPDYSSRYKELFGCPILFEQRENALVFPRALLEQEQAHSDETVSTMLRESAERLLEQATRPRSWSDRVRGVLRYQSDLADTTMESVARALKLSERGLRRRLLAEDHTFSELLGEARCQVARAELRREEASIQEIVDRLGFSEASAFYRAFKRWTGLTPLEYRRLAREEITRQQEGEPSGEQQASRG